MGAQRDQSAISRACDRAAAHTLHVAETQDKVVALLKQIADIQQEVQDPVGARYLIAAGAHGAGFRIAVCVATDGQIGWSLV